MLDREARPKVDLRLIGPYHEYLHTPVRTNRLLDDYVIGIDTSSGKDSTVLTLYRVPGRFRRFLRHLKLDCSTWELEVIQEEVV